VILSHQKDKSLADQLGDTLTRVGKTLGIRFERPVFRYLQNDTYASFINEIKEIYQPDISLVVCVLPTKDRTRYAKIKQYLTIVSPSPSQCVVAETLKRQKSLMSVSTRIIQQVIAKMGGVIWTVELGLSNTIYIGIDVCHDKNTRGRKSIAAVVVSLNRDATRYFSDVIETDLDQLEILSPTRLRDCLINGIKQWMKAPENSEPKKPDLQPTRIIVFRDGVGTGQIQSLYENEINEGLEQAIATFSFRQPVGIAYIIVNKMHNTRLFALSDQGPPQNRFYANPPPGTVVDTTIVDNKFYDFFLISHSENKGTIAPCHYWVLKDTTGLSPILIQVVAYHLSHLYYNWSGAVRVPAPCVYAHKLAMHVKQFLENRPHASLSQKLHFL